MTTPRTEHILGRGVASRRDLRHFARDIKKLRAAKGYSQTVFSRLVGISSKQLSNVECGNNWPSMPVALKICRLLGIRLPKVMDEEEV